MLLFGIKNLTSLLELWIYFPYKGQGLPLLSIQVWIPDNFKNNYFIYISYIYINLLPWLTWPWAFFNLFLLHLPPSSCSSVSDSQGKTAHTHKIYVPRLNAQNLHTIKQNGGDVVEVVAILKTYTERRAS